MNIEKISYPVRLVIGLVILALASGGLLLALGDREGDVPGPGRTVTTWSLTETVYRESWVECSMIVNTSYENQRKIASDALFRNSLVRSYMSGYMSANRPDTDAARAGCIEGTEAAARAIRDAA